MMGKILFDDQPDNIPEADYEGVNFVDKVSCKEIIKYNEGAGKKVVLVDCGVKANIIRCLVNRGVEVVRVPWNYDYTSMEFDGLFLANGPGDPDMCQDAVDIIRKQMSSSRKPICGICMGNQLLAKAGGATIYKLKYGHRSHNQPVRMVGTDKCFVTSQNHGYAAELVDAWVVGDVSRFDEHRLQGLRFGSRSHECRQTFHEGGVVGRNLEMVELACLKGKGRQYEIVVGGVLRVVAVGSLAAGDGPCGTVVVGVDDAPVAAVAREVACIGRTGGSADREGGR